MARNKQSTGISKESVKIVLLGEGMYFNSGMAGVLLALRMMDCLHSLSEKPLMSLLFRNINVGFFALIQTIPIPVAFHIS